MKSLINHKPIFKHFLRSLKTIPSIFIKIICDTKKQYCFIQICKNTSIHKSIKPKHGILVFTVFIPIPFDLIKKRFSKHYSGMC